MTTPVSADQTAACGGEVAAYALGALEAEEVGQWSTYCP